MPNKAGNNNRRCFVTDSPSPFNYWATCDIYLLIIFQKIHRKQPAKKEVLPIIKKSSFHVSFSQKSKILCWRCCDWWPKKKRRKQKLKAQLIERWSWSGVSLILLSNDLHLFKIIDSWETIHITNLMDKKKLTIHTKSMWSHPIHQL